MCIHPCKIKPPHPINHRHIDTHRHSHRHTHRHSYTKHINTHGQITSTYRQCLQYSRAMQILVLSLQGLQDKDACNRQTQAKDICQAKRNLSIVFDGINNFRLTSSSHWPLNSNHRAVRLRLQPGEDHITSEWFGWRRRTQKKAISYGFVLISITCAWKILQHGPGLLTSILLCSLCSRLSNLISCLRRYLFIHTNIPLSPPLSVSQSVSVFL